MSNISTIYKNFLRGRKHTEYKNLRLKSSLQAQLNLSLCRMIIYIHKHLRAYCHSIYK